MEGGQEQVGGVDEVNMPKSERKKILSALEGHLYLCAVLDICFSSQKIKLKTLRQDANEVMETFALVRGTRYNLYRRLQVTQS